VGTSTSGVSDVTVIFAITSGSFPYLHLCGDSPDSGTQPRPTALVARLMIK
jgi:hypothetical protein